MAYAGSSQVTDTICLPIADAQKVLIEARQKRILENDIEVYREDVRLLTAQIGNLQKQLDNALRVDSLDRRMITLLTEQIELHRANRSDFEKKIAGLEKEVRKWRRKNFWTGVIGGAATLTMGFLYLTK